MLFGASPLLVLNTSKIFGGVTMLMMTLGSKYVVGDLGKIHEWLLGSEIMKKVIIFCMFFVATRDVVVAFLLLILYLVIIDGLLHEKRNFCIVPKRIIDKCTTKTDVDALREYEAAKRYIEAYDSRPTIGGGDGVVNGGL